jgi:hypothetical protein
MDVSPCNSLLYLRFLALVLSRTLNGSAEGKKIMEGLKGRRFLPAFLFYVAWVFDSWIERSEKSFTFA